MAGPAQPDPELWPGDRHSSGLYRAGSGNPEGHLFHRPGQESWTLAFCLATSRCMNFSPSLLLGLDPFVPQHLADLDSVGRRCAPRVHKLGARSPVPLKTNADDNGRMGWSHARAKVEYK